MRTEPNTPGSRGDGLDLSQYGRIVAEIQQGRYERHMVFVKRHHGESQIEVRTLFSDYKTGEPRITRGVRLRVQALPQLIKALCRVVEDNPS